MPHFAKTPAIPPALFRENQEEGPRLWDAKPLSPVSFRRRTVVSKD
jgi:hypothetical protein